MPCGYRGTRACSAITGDPRELRALRPTGRLPAGADWFSRTSRPADELHAVGADPDELRDLATDPAHRQELERLREAVRTWMRETCDTGILPEPLLRAEARRAGSEWGIFHPPDASAAALARARYDAILDTAWAVSDGRPPEFFAPRLSSADPAVRFWAATGTGWAAKCSGGDPTTALQPLLTDAEATVRVAAAAWLLRCGTPAAAAAQEALVQALSLADPDVRAAVFRAIDELGDSGRAVWREAVAIPLGEHEDDARCIAARIRQRLDAAGAAADSR